MPFYGGLDWGVAAHAVCVVDERGKVVVRIDAGHDAAGLTDMLARLRKIAPAAELPIAIERPSGLIVDALVGAEHPVVPIHPNAVKACRPRYRAASGKSDPGDAYLLADILRTDGHRLRPLVPMSDDTRALRALVRGRDDLVAQRVALANQLRSLLESFWPGAAAIFAAIDSPIALAFISLSAVFLIGVVVIWAGLAQRSANLQLVGEAVCIVGFAWLALGGWRVMQRRARKMRSGEPDRD